MRRSEADRNAAFMRTEGRSRRRPTAFQCFQRLLLDSARSSAIISLKPIFAFVNKLRMGCLFLVWGTLSGNFSPLSAQISTPTGTSYQVNVNAAGQNIGGDAANEPSICL